MSSDLAAAALRTLMHGDSPIGLALLDRELRYVQINAMLAQANGLSVEAHLGRRVSEVLPLAVDSLLPLLQEVLDSGKARANFHVAAEVPSLPGELSDWEASYLPVFGEDGVVAGVLVQALNRSLERRTQQVRLQGEMHLRNVLDSLFVFVGVLDPEGVLLEANRAPLEAAGIRIEEVRGQPVWETFWWSTDVETQDWLRDAVRCVAAGATVRRDVEVRMAGDSR